MSQATWEEGVNSSIESLYKRVGYVEDSIKQALTSVEEVAETLQKHHELLGAIIKSDELTTDICSNLREQTMNLVDVIDSIQKQVDLLENADTKLGVI